jgi:hypothetical protein
MAVAGAGVAAAAVAAWLFLKGPDAPVTRIPVVTDVSFYRTPDTVLVGGVGTGMVSVGYDVDSVATGGVATGVLARSGDRLVIGSLRASVLEIADSAGGTFELRGVNPGTTEVWPMLVSRTSGDTIATGPRAAIVVVPAPTAILGALAEFRAVREIVNNDTTTDAEALARVEELEQRFGATLRGPGGMADEVGSMLSGMRSLVAARRHADSVLADSNETVPAKQAALRAYTTLAGTVRSGHGPTLRADQVRIGELDAARVGTVLKANVCRYPCEADRRDTVFSAGTVVGIKAWYVRGSSGLVTFEWRRNGVIRKSTSYTTTLNTAGYRTSDASPATESGSWDVRVLNGSRQLVFRHPFDVR